MSRVLRLELSKKRNKPVFTTITKSGKKIMCMLDTGATMPVWSSSEGLFKLIFPDAELLSQKFILSGFGKKPEVVNVYKIPIFCLRDANSCLEFRNLHIVTSFGRGFGCDLILSYTMFSKVDYAVLNRGMDNPVLSVEYDKDIYYISASVNKKRPDIVDNIYSFVSEDILDNKEIGSKIPVDTV